MKIPPQYKENWKAYLKFSTMGLEMGLSVFIGYGIGKWLDKALGTAPWMLIFWFFCGLAAAFRPVIRLIRDYQAKEKEKNP